MKVSKGQSQPEIAAAAFVILYMVLGSPFLYQVLIVTHMRNPAVPSAPLWTQVARKPAWAMLLKRQS